MPACHLHDHALPSVETEEKNENCNYLQQNGFSDPGWVVAGFPQRVPLNQNGPSPTAALVKSRTGVITQM
jgi:hypothetical protein